MIKLNKGNKAQEGPDKMKSCQASIKSIRELYFVNTLNLPLETSLPDGQLCTNG